MKDEQILDMYWSRNEQAIVHTNEKYGKYCYAVANAILNNREDSEESVNDTWIHTWEAIPPQRPNVFKMFLAKITRNISFDKYKARNAVKRGSGQIDLALHELEECVSDTRSVSGDLEAEELAKVIGKFVSDLPEREGDIFIRRYFFLDTAKDIGKRYNLKERNVLVILSRVRKKLKDYLLEEGYNL